TLRICQDDCRITYLEFEYVKGGRSETRHHGVKGETLSELDPCIWIFLQHNLLVCCSLIDFPNEYIQSVEATNDKPKLFRNTVITSIKLETSKGRTSIFGYEVGKKFMLVKTGYSLVGFHGKEGEAIDALGAYFENVLTSPTPTASIPGIVDTWDDGDYDCVKKIQIGLYDEGVSFLKFEYIKGNELVSGDGHGKMTSLGAKEFVLEDGEYLTAVEVSYIAMAGTRYPKVASLRFKTNKRESALFGMDADGSWTASDRFSGCGWVWMDSREDIQLMGTRNFTRCESALHSEVEALRWAMENMLQHSPCQSFGTDCKELIAMINEPQEWPRFATELEKIETLQICFPDFKITHVPRVRSQLPDFV
ncbi:hypothetical protein DY000_02028973, partial [Brassica cretica]